MAARRIHLRITGLVQGVSYRASTQDEARRLGVHGWVRNLPNGDVEAVAEAEPEVLERFVAWCRKGPSEARVESVAVTDQSIDKPLSRFEVLASGSAR
jgi:acylphosphatase